MCLELQSYNYHYLSHLPKNLDKALKSIDAFGDGYFDDMNNLPYYQAETQQVDLRPEDNFTSTFTITPFGAAGEGFNEVVASYISEFLDVTINGNTISVSKNEDYDWAGWVNTPITFDFPLIEGAVLPYDGYELLSVGVNINFHLIGESFSASFPALKARLLDSNGAVVKETISSVTEGQGYFIFDELNPGTYSITLGSDINGDNSWGGPGEMSGMSETFEITGSNVAEISVMLAPESEGSSNGAPVITNSPITQATVNSTYFHVVQASDPDGDSLSYQIELINKETGAENDFLSFTNNILRGTPRDDDIGEYDARIIVSDGTDAVTQDFTLVVDE